MLSYALDFRACEGTARPCPCFDRWCAQALPRAVWWMAELSMDDTRTVLPRIMEAAASTLSSHPQREVPFEPHRSEFLSPSTHVCHNVSTSHHWRTRPSTDRTSRSKWNVHVEAMDALSCSAARRTIDTWAWTSIMRVDCLKDGPWACTCRLARTSCVCWVLQT